MSSRSRCKDERSRNYKQKLDNGQTVEDLERNFDKLVLECLLALVSRNRPVEIPLPMPTICQVSVFLPCHIAHSRRVQKFLPWDSEKYDWLRSVQFQAQAQGEFKDLHIDNCRLEGQDQHIGMER